MKTFFYAFPLCTSALLTACGGDSSSTQINEVNPESSQPEKSRIQFQPAEGRLPLPNDLLFSGTIDGTLEAPDESAAKEAGEPVDLGNPAVALGSVDGWSTSTPMLLSLDMAESSSVDASTVNASTVFLVETDCEPGLQNCSSFVPLGFGTDFVAQVLDSGDAIALAPLAPLKPSTTYLVGISAEIQDDRGESIAGSEFYEQVTRNDVDLSGDATFGGLQAAINGYESLLALATGEAADNFAFSASWTTGSVGAGFTGVLAQLAQTSALAPASLSITNVAHAGASPDPVTVRQALVASLAADLIEQGLDAGAAVAQAEASIPAAFANGLLLQGELSLPYYSGTGDDGSDPLLNGWTAACDSGAVLANASDEELAVASPGANDTSCMAFGLRDLGLDTERYITRYNPIPAARTANTLEVQITVPNPDLIAAPWPLVIVQHGIGSKKEDTLALSAALSGAGLATVAIDHPLHGSRALVSESAGGASVNASGNPTVYMNLAQLPVARDNLNQSVADMLGLRAALNNGISGVFSSDDFNLDNISFNGISLGSITGVSFLDLAQSSVARTTALGLPALDLSVNRASLVVPGGGIAPLLIDSASFGSLVKGSVLAGLAGEDGPDVANSFIAFIPTNTANCASSDLGCNFLDYTATLDQAALAVVGNAIAQFAFAAQTIIHSADPLNAVAPLASTGLDLLAIEIVGDGVNNLPDQVIPNQSSVAGMFFGGTEPIAAALGLSGVNASNAPQAAGIVRFSAGHHASILRASADPSLPPSSAESAVQVEMQSEVAAFLSGLGVNVFDATYVVESP